MKHLRFQHLFILLILVLFSCTEEAIEPTEAPTTNSASQRFGDPIDMICFITGSNCVTPGTEEVFYYSGDNVQTTLVTWSVLDGNMSIVSSSVGTNVRISFANNFTGGRIQVVARAANGAFCQTTYHISKCSTGCTPPTNVQITQTMGSCPDDIFEFKAVPNGSTTNGTYQWESVYGANIISGQGTSTIRVRMVPPATSWCSVKLVHVNECENTQLVRTKFGTTSINCGGGGFE